MVKIQENQLKGQNHLKEVGKPMLYTHVEINGVSTTLKMGTNTNCPNKDYALCHANTKRDGSSFAKNVRSNGFAHLPCLTRALLLTSFIDSRMYRYLFLYLSFSFCFFYFLSFFF